MEPVRRTVIRMAEREAAAHLLVASNAVAVRLRLDVLTCPWCGAGGSSADRRPVDLPIRTADQGPEWVPDSSPRPGLRTLGCEVLTARSLLAVAVAAHRFDRLAAGTFQTRAVTLAELLDANHGTVEPRRAVEALDAAERWADLLLPDGHCAGDGRAGDGRSAGEPWCAAAGPTLPAATRLYRAGVPGAPHFLTPHCTHAEYTRLNEVYLNHRLAAVRRALA